MVWTTSITDILNTWDTMGVFAYVIPFLLIFAVVFAILQKTKLLGDKNSAVQAIVALAIGLLALQFDFVSTFYSEVFPRFGVGLAIFLVLVILIGFFYSDDKAKTDGAIKWIGWLTGIGVVVWSLTSWDFWADNWSLGWWIEEYFWPLIILAAVVTVIVVVANGGKDPNSKSIVKSGE